MSVDYYVKKRLTLNDIKNNDKCQNIEIKKKNDSYWLTLKNEEPESVLGVTLSDSKTFDGGEIDDYDKQIYYLTNYMWCNGELLIWTLSDNLGFPFLPDEEQYDLYNQYGELENAAIKKYMTENGHFIEQVRGEWIVALTEEELKTKCEAFESECKKRDEERAKEKSENDLPF